MNKMLFSVVTLFPEIIEFIFSKGVVGQACRSQKVRINCINPRQFTSDVHRTVDDRPYGGGDGMVMLAEPLRKSLLSFGVVPKTDFSAAKSDSTEKQSWVIYLSPQGGVLNEAKAVSLSKRSHVVLICGRYGGIDQRVLNHFVDEEISVGDYVLSGGELASAILIDVVSRKVPGVLGHQDSSSRDSFCGDRIEEPQFTRPREFMGQLVPETLLSGHHEEIAQWKSLMRDLITLKKRPDLMPQEAKDWTQLRVFWEELSEADKKVLGLEKFPLS